MRFYGYRHYKPDIGRWLNRDPIEERGHKIIANPLSKDTDQDLLDEGQSTKDRVYKYRALKNNPVFYIDPDGRKSFSSYVNWSYQVVYRKQGMYGGLSGVIGYFQVGGAARYVSVSLPGSAAKNRPPCWDAWGIIVYARPSINTAFSVSENPDDPGRLWQTTSSGSNQLRYRPQVEFNIGGNTTTETLWGNTQMVPAFVGDFSPGGYIRHKM